jgi:hypothetical protein
VSSDDARRRINFWTTLIMAAGATLSVYLNVTQRIPEGGWTIVWNYELVLYGAMGAFPGWILNGMLKRELSPKTHGDAQTKQPRCRECGAILAQQGERCPDCRAFTR